MGGYSRVSIYLDKARNYTVVKDGDKSVNVKIDDNSHKPLSAEAYESRVVRSAELYQGEDGIFLIRIALFKSLSMMSDFFLQSPPRIIVNVKTEGGRDSAGERNQKVIAPEKKIVKKTTRKVDKGFSNKTDKTESEPSPLDNFEGLEDLILPSLDPFVEIFDTGNPLSVYHISLPPHETLKDYPETPQRFGEYVLREPALKSAAQSLGAGDFQGALNILNRTVASAKQDEEFQFLRADAVFQKALVEGDVSDAVEMYEDLIATYPKSRHLPGALMQAGRGKLKLKSFNGAAEAFRKVINKFGESPYAVEARLDLAGSIAGKGKREEALRLYKDFIEKYPSSPFLAKAVYGAAENMAQLRRYRKAQRLFEKGLKRWPDYSLRDPDLIMMIGESYYHMKMFDEALRHFNKLVNLYPQYRQSDHAMGRRADIYLHLGKAESAVKIYEETESRYPGSDGALIGMIRRADLLASNGGDINRVMKLYREIYEKYVENPLSEVATLKAGLFLTSRRKYMEAFEMYDSFLLMYPKGKLKNSVFDEMLKVFTILLEKNHKEENCMEIIRLAKKNERLTDALKERAEALLWVGNCYFRYGQYNDAVQAYEKIRDGEEQKSVLYMKGRSMYMAGDFGRSIKVMEKYIKQYPESNKYREITYLLAVAYEKSDAPEEAAGFYSLYLKLEKDKELMAKGLTALGDVLRKVGRPGEAAEAYRKGIKLYPKEDVESLSKVYYLLGEVLFEERSFQKALNAYNRAINLSSEKPFREAEYKAALCFDRLGETDKAEAVLKKISEGSDNPFWSNLSAAKLEDMR